MKLTDPRYEFDLTNLLFFAGAAGVVIALFIVALAYAVQNTGAEVRLLVLGLLALEGVLTLVKNASKAGHRRDFERAWRQGFQYERNVKQ